MRAIAALTIFSLLSSTVGSAEPGATILSRQVVCKEAGRYIGWPTIARTDKGELLIVFSGDRDQHVCPFGKVQLVRSSDNGATWSEPQTIQDLPAVDGPVPAFGVLRELLLQEVLELFGLSQFLQATPILPAA